MNNSGSHWRLSKVAAVVVIAGTIVISAAEYLIRLCAHESYVVMGCARVICVAAFLSGVLVGLFGAKLGSGPRRASDR